MGKRIAPISQRDNQTKRVARVLRIIQQINNRPNFWNRKALASHYEVSERSITSDLELIRIKLGLDLKHNGKTYYFADLPKLPDLTYSFGEALALITAARMAQSVPGINSADLAAAIARLESMFPDQLRPLLHEATESLPNQADRSHRQSMLTLLHRSRIEQRQVSIVYQTAMRQGATNKRTVEPYEIIPYGRSWQLIAFDHKRKDILQFKIDRILEAQLLERFYTIPTGFDIEQYMGSGWGAMRGDEFPVEEVILIFENQTGRRVAEEDWHPSQQVSEREDGRIEISFQVGITPEMEYWLLYYGKNVSVEKPSWLRQSVFNNHQEGMKNNA